MRAIEEMNSLKLLDDAQTPLFSAWAKNFSENTAPHKRLLQWLFPSISSGCTITVIESAAKFNNDFIENHCKLFTTVFTEQPLQNIIYSNF
jgi:hypothetical protein